MGNTIAKIFIPSQYWFQLPYLSTKRSHPLIIVKFNANIHVKDY